MKNLFKIIKKSCIYKKYSYLYRVNHLKKAMKTTIKTTDFSENTLQLFNQAKEKKSFLLAWDLVRLLIDNDFPPKDVKEFMKHNFKNNYKFLDYSI